MKFRLFVFYLFFVAFSPSLIAKKPIDLESIFKENKFYPKMVSGLRSMTDGDHFTILNQQNKIEKYRYSDGEFIETLISVNNIKDAPFKYIDDYSFNFDESRVLLATEKEEIYRHSYRAWYFIYDLKSQQLIPLSQKGKQQLASFSPDGNHIAFVYDNNLYYKNLTSLEEKAITHDGEKSKLIYGAPDWVYEEEFGFTKAYEWSPDGNKIAFYRFDESRVKQYALTFYEGIYPEIYNYKYPKAGEDNSIVSILIYDLLSGNTIVSNIGDNTDIYIPRIKWTGDPGYLSIIRLNRLQNQMEILHINSETGKSQLILNENNKYYISEINDNSLVYLKNGEKFLFVSERSGWRHIYCCDFKYNEILQVSSGNYDIGEIISVNEVSNTIYYSSYESSPLRKDIYRVNIDGSHKKKISIKDGWNEASFSKNFKYVIFEHSRANQPFVFTLCTSDGKYIRTLEDNEYLQNILREYGFRKKEFFSFTNTANIDLNGYMIKPPGFSRKKTYPVLIYVYGGPESQLVTDKFSVRDSWFQMLAQMGYIIVCVDNRGTDNRGEEFRKMTYMQLGKLETEDQTELAKYLGSLPFVDKSRIGIFGWSYGGYMSLLCLFNGADIFKVAISVAPVTNWRYYDTIYTERFMRTPDENPSGYDNNSPVFMVDKMKGKLLLIHGMADDNVHMQNSAELIEKLVQSGKQFDMQFYPNKNHGIYGGNTSYHLYKKMTEFIKENL